MHANMTNATMHAT
jgi:hypothetical protein